MNDGTQQTTTKDEINPQPNALTDLPVADEEANQVEAGSGGRLFLGTQVGVY